MNEELSCCCVCLEKIINTNEIMIFECSHSFHTECVNKFIKLSCPLCRKELNEKIFESFPEILANIKNNIKEYEKEKYEEEVNMIINGEYGSRTPSFDFQIYLALKILEEHYGVPRETFPERISISHDIPIGMESMEYILNFLQQFIYDSESENDENESDENEENEEENRI